MSQNLCLDCAMCCNGVMFKALVLQQKETKYFSRPIRKEYRVIPTITIHKTKNHFVYPFEANCEHLKRDNKCKIYENRPYTCRSFKCEMLERYENEEISYNTALNKIKEIKSLKVDTVNSNSYLGKIKSIMKA